MEASWKTRIPNANSPNSSSASSSKLTPTTFKLNLDKVRERHSSIRESFGIKNPKSIPPRSQENSMVSCQSKSKFYSFVETNNILSKVREACKEVEVNGDKILKTLTQMMKK